jgi:type IV fimbrial biogenesis protein FimT
MLTRAGRASAGFSLIELMVTIAVIGIAMVIAIPTFGKWTADASVRAVAESLTNAIRKTQAAAIAQGRVGMFALTTATPPVATSTPNAAGPNWFAALNPLAGSDETATTLGMILKSTEGTQRAVQVTGPALICFSSVGRQTNVTTQNLGGCSVVSSSSPTTYTVSRATGATRSFKVLVYLGGQVRMCDAAKTLSSSNPDGCPSS